MAGKSVAARSGNPAKRAASSAQDFKKKRGSGLRELPSGLWMKLTNPGGLAIFMKHGAIPNSLMPIVSGALAGKETTVESLLTPDKLPDPQLIEDMAKLMDDVVVACAVEPRVYPTPENPEDRDDEKLYADEIEDEDKMFIFQWVSGGVTDLETFRLEHQQGMADMARVIQVGM